MKLFLIICALIIPNALSASIETVREVLILTDDNYESAINSNEYIMLDFYAPWCGPCRKLTPEYFKAAEMLHEKQSEIKLAKVNVDDEEKVAEVYEVRSLPTLKFFRKGSVIEYTGGRKAEQIVAWLIKKTGTPMKQLSSKEEVQSFIDDNKIAIIGFFKNQESDGAQTYLNIGNKLFDVPFANISDDALFSEYDAKEGTIILFKQFDEPKVVYNGELTEESIKDFIKENSQPLIQEFHLDEEIIDKIFDNSIRDFLFLLPSKETDNFKQHEKGIVEVSKEYKDRVIFMTVDIDDEELEPLLEELRGPAGLPKVVLAHVPNPKRFKLEYYKYEGENIEADNIRKFLQDYFDGKIEPYEPNNDDSNEKTDEPESVTAEATHEEPESITEETQQDITEEVKQESEDTSEEESNGAKEEESEESQEENSAQESNEEKKEKRSYKRALEDSDMIKKMYRAIHLPL